MNELLAWTLFALAGAGVLFVAVVAVKGYGVMRVGWLNLANLRRMQERFDRTDNAAEKAALDAVLKRCAVLRAQWVLKESELHVWAHTQELVESVARPFFPKSAKPLEQARIGRLLDAFLDIRNHIQTLSQQRGVRALTQFRLRHVRWFHSVWKRKIQWDESRPGQAASKFKLFFLVRWSLAIVRALDLVFWSMKMAFYFFYDVVFKVLLLRWYLLVGEKALEVYSDTAPESAAPDEDVLADMDALPKAEGEEQALPEPLRQPVRDSRNALLLHTRPLKWAEVQERYRELTTTVARFHHPDSADPLYEVKLFDLMLAVGRMADQVVSLREQTVFKRVLDLRLSHIARVKDATDWVLENELFQFVQKYKVGTAVKYSTLVYRAFKKGHPGILFKDFAFVLAREGVKRWLAVYAHNKIVIEANRVYMDKSETEKSQVRG